MSATETPTARIRPLAAASVEELARLDTHGEPVLSFYLDLDPTRFPTPDARHSEAEALLDEARRQGAGGEADRVRAWLDGDDANLREGQGLAIFSSKAAGVFEVVRLPRPVEPLAVVDLVPWLEPAAAMVAPGDWGVAIVSRRRARLLRGGRDGLIQFAVLDDDLHKRHSQGGWSQARYQRGIEEQVAWHVRDTAERLLRAHRHQPFAHLVIVCSDELRPVVEHSLHSELRAILAGAVAADLEHAPYAQIATAVAPLIERHERDRERGLVERLEQALQTPAAAAAGLDDVLGSLEQQRVAVLVVPERSELRAGVCPACGRVSTDGERTCPLDGHALTEVNAVERMIALAAEQSAEVVVARYEPDWLHAHGDVAALLRW